MLARFRPSSLADSGVVNPSLEPGPLKSSRRLAFADRCVLALLVAGLPLILWGLSKVSVENNVEHWLPQTDSGAEILRWHHEHFDPRERFLVTWDSSSLDDERFERLAAELAEPADADQVRRGRDPKIERVSTPRDLIVRMHENNVPLDVAIQRCVGVSIGHGFLKVRLTASGRAAQDAVQQQILDALSALGYRAEILPAIPAALANPADGGNLDASELPRKLLSIPAHDFQLRWEGMTPASPETERIQSAVVSLRQADSPVVESAFFAPGSPAALTVILSPEGSKSATRTIAVVRNAAERVGIPANELHLGGGPVGRSRLNQEAERALWNTEYPAWNLYKRSPVAMSVLVGMLLVFVLLRSLPLTFIVLGVAVYVCMATVAIVPSMGDTLNMVLVVMPNLLFVITLSGALHLLNYWRRESETDPETAVVVAMRKARLPCSLASITTAIGTASLVTSSLEPIRQFGVYSTIGVLGSLAMVLLGLPAILKLCGPRLHATLPRASGPSMWLGFGRLITRHHVATQWLILLVFLQAVWGLRWFDTETKVIRYFPSHLRIIEDYDFFEQSLAGVVNVDVVVHFNQPAIEATNISERMELIRRVENSLRQEQGVTGTLSVADFRQPITEPDADAPLRIRLLHRKGLQRLRNGVFGGAADGDESAHSASSLTSLVRRPLEAEEDGVPVRFAVGDEAWRVRVQCTVLSDLSYESLLAAMRQRIQPLLAEVPGADFVITGSVPLFLRAQQVLLRSLISSLGLAFLLITVVVIGMLRSIPGGLYAMLPNIFPVGVTFGWISWMNVPVDVGTMMTASIAIGIAIDGTLHLITWFQECSGKRDGHEAVCRALDYCGPALFQTSLIIALGMLMLSGADLLLISRFGWIMSLLVVTAFIGDMVLLPALLASHMGQILNRKHRSAHTPLPRQPVESVVAAESDAR